MGCIADLYADAGGGNRTRFWSQAADREKLQEDLVHAPVRVMVIPGATHFVHLDHEERGREVLIEEVVKFVGKR